MKKRLGLIMAVLLALSMVLPAYAAEDAAILSLASTVEEPDGSGIPKDDPVLMAEAGYGYAGTFDYESAPFQPVRVSEGIHALTEKQLLYWGGGVVVSSGSALLGIRNSYIRGETAVPAAPITGEDADLLVSGNIRTILALDASQTFLINSTVVSRNLGAITLLPGAAVQSGAELEEPGDEPALAGEDVSLSGEEPALAGEDVAQTGEEPALTSIKQTGFYAYGSEIVTIDGGYGAYAGLLSNLYVFASAVRGAQIGILADTCETVLIGDSTDGENFKNLPVVLSESDRKDAQTPLYSIVEGGRNALVITSHNKPAYWQYEGYTQEDIPWRHSTVAAHHNAFLTDLTMDKGASYGAQEQAYIRHTAGSVILVKSANTQIYLDDCELLADMSGTGYLVQSVCTNDVVAGTTVPDTEEYPGILVDMQNMAASGDIAHEDYQRDFLLMLTDTTLDGAMNEYDCAHWKAAAVQEGFTDFVIDQTYNTHHGLQVSLTEGSVWNVTAQSHLSRLYTETDCKVNGIIFLNGARQENIPGTTYEGDVVVMPLGYEGTTLPGADDPEETTSAQEDAQGQEPTTAQAASPEQSPKQTQPANPSSPQSQGQPQTQPATQPQTQPVTTKHEHNWVSNGGSPADCTHDGVHVWICKECGEEYNETLPAMGHDWILEYELPATCTMDGSRQYRCSRCGATNEETTGEKAHGHKMSASPVVTLPATCTTDGEQIYQCEYCLATVKTETIPAYGHNWQLTTDVAATCTTPGITEYTCSYCGEVHTETYAAYGHNWYISNSTPATCTEWGEIAYTCQNCGQLTYDYLEPTGHSWTYEYSVPVTCLTSGYDVYHCYQCGADEWFNFQEATGHNYIIYPTPGQESLTHSYECTKCGDYWTEPHTSGGGYCPVCGYSGAFG